MELLNEAQNIILTRILLMVLSFERLVGTEAVDPQHIHRIVPRHFTVKVR